MKKIIICLQLLIILFTIFFIICYGVAKVEGDSMKPTLNNKQFIIYKKDIKNLKRFDIVVIKVDNNLYVKRVIGLPNENIKYLDNNLYVNNKLVEEKYLKSVTHDFDVSTISENNYIPNNKILVLGDNRLYSYDSRDFGLVDLMNVKGIVVFKLF